MSLHSLQRRRSRSPYRRPTRPQHLAGDGPKATSPSKNKAHERRPLLSRRKSQNTRRRRIYDLLSHVPAFLVRFLRLLSFVVLLLPAFVVFVWHYATCDRIAAYYGEGGSNSSEDQDKSSADGDSQGDLKDRCRDPFFSRHYLDMYGSRTPSLDDEKKPAVIFLTGGAWIIGYRMWGALLARALVPFGILVIVPDYRNFPRVNIEGMVNDVDMSIQWVFDHVKKYGGDEEKVVLVGQSAGAHIGGVVVALKVLDWMRGESRRAMVASGEDCNGHVANGSNVRSNSELPFLKSTYTPRQLRGFVSTSSPLNLVTMRPVFHRHGLSANVQRSIFGASGEGSVGGGSEDEDVFQRWSPYHLYEQAGVEYASLSNQLNGERASLELKDIFPRQCVIHGTSDKTVPSSEATNFIALLSKLRIPAETRLYDGWTHTDPILEAPMRGDHTYHHDVFELVCGWTATSEVGNDSSSIVGEKSIEGHSYRENAFDENHPMLRPICPSLLVEAARVCNPF